MNRQTVSILLGVLFAGLILIMPTGKAFASYANTSASLDWSQFQIAGVLNWTLDSINANAIASNSSGENFNSSSTAIISNASASTIMNTAGDYKLWTQLATSNVSLDNYGWSTASGSAVLTGSFTATSSGPIFIYIPYTLSVDLLAPDGSGASSYGKTTALISLWRSGGSVNTDTM